MDEPLVRRTRRPAAGPIREQAGCLLVLSVALASAVHAQELDCLVEPYMVVHVNSEAQGVLRKIHVDRGDVVRQGQAVAALESSLQEARVQVARARADMEAAIEANQARVEFGVRKLARTQELAADGISSLSELDEAQTEKLLAELALAQSREERAVAKLELALAQAELRMRTLRSPVSGVVVERLLAPGDLAGRDPVLEIAQIDPLRVEVFAPVALLGEIAVGMEGTVRLEPPVNGAYRARVTVVDRVIDAASGTFGVRLELPNPKFRLPAGLKCKVRFPLK